MLLSTCFSVSHLPKSHPSLSLLSLDSTLTTHDQYQNGTLTLTSRPHHLRFGPSLAYWIYILASDKQPGGVKHTKDHKITMSSRGDGGQNEPVNEQMVANMYTAMQSDLNQVYSKITELEMEVSEHSLVINAIQPLDPSRRCYRMIGGVLVERTIKEVLPAVQRNKEGIEEVIARLNEALVKKKKELADFESKYKIRIRKSDNEVQNDGSKKEGTAQGVLVGPAGSSD